MERCGTTQIDRIIAFGRTLQCDRLLGTVVVACDYRYEEMPKGRRGATLASLLIRVAVGAGLGVSDAHMSEHVCEHVRRSILSLSLATDYYTPLLARCCVMRNAYPSHLLMRSAVRTVYVLDGGGRATQGER